MAKDSLNDMNLDDDMWSDLDSGDFGFDGDFDGDGSPIDKEGDRSPITSHIKSVGKDLMAAGSGVVVGAGAGIEKTIDREFPEVTNFKNFALQGLADAQRAKDDILKQVSPVLKEAKETARRFSQIGENAFPNANIFKKISSLLEEPKEDYAEKKVSIEQMRNSAIDAELSKVFAAQAQERAIDRKQATIDRLIDKRESRAVNAQLTSLISEIRTDTLFQASFMRSSATAYMKKSLELKYRHLFVAQDTLEALKLTTKSMETRLDAIKHNTALPDAQKIRLLERAINQRKEKVVTSLTDMGSQMFDKARKRFMEDYAEPAMDMLETMISQLSTGADMLEMSQEMGVSTKGMALEQGGGFLGGILGSDFIKKIIRKIPKHVRQEIRDTAAGGKGSLMSMLNRLADGTWDGDEEKIPGIVKWFAEMVGGVPKGHGKFENTAYKDAFGDGKITNKFVRTVEVIIPRYLSMQTKYLERLATGNKNAKEQIWDWKTNQFTTKEDLQAKMQERVFGTEKQHNAMLLDSANKVREAISTVNYQSTDEAANKEYNRNIRAQFDNIAADVSRGMMNLAHAKFRMRPDDIELLDEFAYGGNGDSNFIKVFFKGFKKSRAVAVAKALLYILKDPTGRPNQQIVTAISKRVEDLEKGFEYERNKIMNEVMAFGYESIAGNILDQDSSGDYTVNREKHMKLFEKFQNKDVRADREINVPYHGSELKTSSEKKAEFIDKVKGVINDVFGMSIGDWAEEKFESLKDWGINFASDQFEIKKEDIEAQIAAVEKGFKEKKDYVKGKFASLKTTLKIPVNGLIKIISDKIAENPNLEPFRKLVFTDDGKLRDLELSPEEIKNAIDHLGTYGSEAMMKILKADSKSSWVIREIMLADDRWHEVLNLYEEEDKRKKEEEAKKLRDQAKQDRLIGNKLQGPKDRSMLTTNTEEYYRKKFEENDGITIGKKTFIRDKTTKKFKVESEKELRDLLSNRQDLGFEDVNLEALRNKTKSKTTYEQLAADFSDKPIITKKINDYDDAGLVTPYTLEEIVGTRLDKIITIMGGQAGAEKTISRDEYDSIMEKWWKSKEPQQKGTTEEVKLYEGMNDAEIFKTIMGRDFMKKHYTSGGIQDQAKKDRKIAVDAYFKQQVKDYYSSPRFDRNITDIPYGKGANKKTIVKNEKGQFVIDSEEALDALMNTVGGLNLFTDIDITPWIDAVYEQTGRKFKLTSKQLLTAVEKQAGADSLIAKYKEEAEKYAAIQAKKEPTKEDKKKKGEKEESNKSGAFTIGNNPDKKLDVNIAQGASSEDAIKAIKDATAKQRDDQRKLREVNLREQFFKDKAEFDKKYDKITSAADITDAAAIDKWNKNHNGFGFNEYTWGELEDLKNEEFKKISAERERYNTQAKKYSEQSLEKAKEDSKSRVKKSSVDKKLMLELDSFIAGLTDEQLDNMQQWIIAYCPQLDEDEARIRYYNMCKRMDKKYEKQIFGDGDPLQIYQEYQKNPLDYGYIYYELRKIRLSRKDTHLSKIKKNKKQKAKPKSELEEMYSVVYGNTQKGKIDGVDKSLIEDFLRNNNLFDKSISELTSSQRRKLRTYVRTKRMEREQLDELTKEKNAERAANKWVKFASDAISNEDFRKNKSAIKAYYNMRADDTDRIKQENEELKKRRKKEAIAGRLRVQDYDEEEARYARMSDQANLKNKQFKEQQERQEWGVDWDVNFKARGGTIDSITGQDVGTVNKPTLIAGGNALAGEHGVETIVPHNKTDDAIRAYLEAKAYHEGNTFAKGGTIAASERRVTVPKDFCLRIDRNYNKKWPTIDEVDVSDDDWEISQQILKLNQKLMKKKYGPEWYCVLSNFKGSDWDQLYNVAFAVYKSKNGKYEMHVENYSNNTTSRIRSYALPDDGPENILDDRLPEFLEKKDQYKKMVLSKSYYNPNFKNPYKSATIEKKKSIITDKQVKDFKEKSNSGPDFNAIESQIDTAWKANNEKRAQEEEERRKRDKEFSAWIDEEERKYTEARIGSVGNSVDEDVDKAYARYEREKKRLEAAKKSHSNNETTKINPAHYTDSSKKKSWWQSVKEGASSIGNAITGQIDNFKQAYNEAYNEELKKIGAKGNQQTVNGDKKVTVVDTPAKPTPNENKSNQSATVGNDTKTASASASATSQSTGFKLYKTRGLPENTVTFPQSLTEKEIKEIPSLERKLRKLKNGKEWFTVLQICKASQNEYYYNLVQAVAQTDGKYVMYYHLLKKDGTKESTITAISTYQLDLKKEASKEKKGLWDKVKGAASGVRDVVTNRVNKELTLDELIMDTNKDMQDALSQHKAQEIKDRIEKKATEDPTFSTETNKAINDKLKAGADNVANLADKVGLTDAANIIREKGAGFDANKAIATAADAAGRAKDYVVDKIKSLWSMLGKLTTKNSYREIWDNIAVVFDAASDDPKLAEKLSPDDRALLKAIAKAIDEGDYRLSKIKIPDNASPELKQAIMLYQDKVRETTENMSEEELAKSTSSTFLGGLQSRIAKSARNFMENEHVQGAWSWAKVTWTNFKEWVPKIPELIMKKLADLFSLGKEKMIDVVTDIRALVNIIAMKTIGGENFDLDMIKNIEVATIDRKLPMSERVWRATKKGVKTAYKAAKWAVTQPFSAARHTIFNKKAEVFAKPAGNEPLNRTKHVRITDQDWDSGVFHDASCKKECKSIADIKGIVYNYKGEPLFTEGEYERGLITADGEPIKNLGSRAGRFVHHSVGYAGGKLKQLGSWGWEKLGNIPGMELAKKGFNIAKTVVGTPLNIYKGVLIRYKDVFLKDNIERGPLLTAKEMKQGLVVFMDGKPVKDVYSIDRPVKYTNDPANGSLAGQYAITNEHIQQGLVDEKNKPLTKFGNKFGAMLRRGADALGGLFSKMGGATGWLLGKAWEIVKSGGKKLFEKKNPYIDVYNSEGKLLLYGKGIKGNEYVFESGKPVTSAYTITEKVYDRKEHNIQVSDEDIKNGLYDINHKKLTKWRGRSIAYKALTAGFVGVKWAAGKLWGGLKKLGKMGGGGLKKIFQDLMEGGTSLFDYLHGKVIETVEAFKNSRPATAKDLESIVGERLDKMLVIMEKGHALAVEQDKEADAAAAAAEKEKKGVSGDKDGDGIREGSYEDQQRKKKEKIERVKAAAMGGANSKEFGFGSDLAGMVASAMGGGEGGGIMDYLSGAANIADIWDAIRGSRSDKGDSDKADNKKDSKDKTKDSAKDAKNKSGKTSMFGRGGKLSRFGRGLKYMTLAAFGGQEALDAAQEKDAHKDMLADAAQEAAEARGEARRQRAREAIDNTKNKAKDKISSAKGAIGEFASNTAAKAKGLGSRIANSSAGKAVGKFAGSTLAKAIAKKVAIRAAVAAAGLTIPIVGEVVGIGLAAWTAIDIGIDIAKWLFCDSDAEKSLNKIRFEGYGVDEKYDDEVEDLEEEVLKIINGEREAFTDEELEDWMDEFDFSGKDGFFMSMIKNSLGLPFKAAQYVAETLDPKHPKKVAAEKRLNYFKIWMQKRFGSVFNICHKNLAMAVGKDPSEEIDWDDIDDVEGGDKQKLRVIKVMVNEIKQILAKPAIEGTDLTLKSIELNEKAYERYLTALDDKEAKAESKEYGHDISAIKYDDQNDEYFFTIDNRRFFDDSESKIKQMREEEVAKLKEEKKKKDAEQSKTNKADMSSGGAKDEKEKDKKPKVTTPAEALAAAEAMAEKGTTSKPVMNGTKSKQPEPGAVPQPASKGFFQTAFDIALLLNPIGILFKIGSWLFSDSDAEKSFNKIRYEGYGVDPKFDDEMEDLEERIFKVIFKGKDALSDKELMDFAEEFKFLKQQSFFGSLLSSKADNETYQKVMDRKLEYFKIWVQKRVGPIYRLCHEQLALALGKKPDKEIDWDDIDDIKGGDKVKLSFIKNLINGINQILSAHVSKDGKFAHLTVRDIAPTEEAYNKFALAIINDNAKNVTEKSGHKISKIEYDETKKEFFFTLDGKRIAAADRTSIEKLYIDAINKIKLEKHTAQVQEQKASKEAEAKRKAEVEEYKDKSKEDLKKAQHQASVDAGVIPAPANVNTGSNAQGATSSNTANLPTANNAAGSTVANSALAGAMLGHKVPATGGVVATGGSVSVPTIQTLPGTLADNGAPSQAAQQSTRLDVSALGKIPGIENINKEQLAAQFMNRKLTRGIRNNNPMNVTVSKWSKACPGFVDGDREVKGSGVPAPIGRGKYGMCRFIAPEYGIAAAVRLIKDVYARQGKVTIRAITAYYSPPSENDTEGLIRAYCQASGFKPNEPVNWDNQQACFNYIKMIIKRESGNRYNDELIMRGFLMGLGKVDSSGSIKNDSAAVSPEDAKEPKAENIPADVSSTPTVGQQAQTGTQAVTSTSTETPKVEVPATAQQSTPTTGNTAAITQVSTPASAAPASSGITVSVSGGASAPVSGQGLGANTGLFGAAPTVGGVPGTGAPAVDMSQIPASATPPKGDVNELGSFVSKYESGSKGSACVAYDTLGGTSYGTYQLSSRQGSLKEFVQWCKTRAPEVYAALNPYLAQANTGSKTGDFVNRWLALVKEGKINYKLEHEYYVNSFFGPALKRLQKINPAAAQAVSSNRALQEAYWSTAVQHGAYGTSKGAPGIFSKVYKPGMAVPDYLRAIYADRSRRFSDPKVLKGIRRRFKEELADMLAIHQNYGNQVANADGSPAAAAAAAGAMAGASAGYVEATPADGYTPGTPGALGNVFAGASGGAGGSVDFNVNSSMPVIPSGPVDMSGIKLQPGIDFENMHPALKQRFAAMAKEYKEKFGKPVVVTSGKRSLEKQAELYRTLPRGKAAKPNPLAPHICGLALDANSADMNKADSSGLLAKYGLWRPLKNGLGRCPKEAWHVEIQGSRDPEKKVITEGTLAAINAAYKSQAPNPNVSVDMSTTGASIMDTSANGVQSQSPMQQAKQDGVGQGGLQIGNGAPTIGGTPTGGPNISLGGTSGGTPTISTSTGGASAGGSSAAAPAAAGASVTGPAPTIAADSSSSAVSTGSDASISAGAPAPTISSVNTVSSFPASSGSGISSNTVSQTGQVSEPIENNSQLQELKIISQLLSNIRGDMQGYFTKIEAKPKEEPAQTTPKKEEPSVSGFVNWMGEGANQLRDALAGALMSIVKQVNFNPSEYMQNYQPARPTQGLGARAARPFTQPIDMQKHSTAGMR